MKIGENIKKFRYAKKMTQKELAEILNVTTRTIQNYESGNREPSISTIKSLAEALDVEIISLLGSKKYRDYLGVTVPHIKPNTDIERKKSYLLSAFNELNKLGKKRLLTYARDLLEIPRYKNKTPREEVNLTPDKTSEIDNNFND